MSLVLGDNFSYGGSKPLDARLKYNTLVEMKAVADATMYNGCTAYCEETDKTYQWKSTNTVDENTGRWREYPSGGSGGGHTIEDSEGTSLTQRDTMQFGEGFKAEDDSTNEKTVISPDVMQSGDMDDVITPLPSVAPKKEGIKYSTTEQVIGEWIDSKPLYQKVFTFGTISAGSYDHIDITSLGIDAIPIITGSLVRSDNTVFPIVITHTSEIRQQVTVRVVRENNTDDLQIATGGAISGISSAFVILCYTKTTDTPNT